MVVEEIMSRIGRKPIPIPQGVTVAINSDALEVKGPKGTLRAPVPPGIQFKQDQGVLTVERSGDEQKALHGLARALAANAIKGVTDGFARDLDIVGVGYKADVQGRRVVFNLGYSHPIEFPLPDGIEVKIERRPKTVQQYQMSLIVSGIDKQLVGQVAAEMRGLREPDAYKGKGVRYANQPMKLKPGKTGK
jgi:large subunit ribosomal protein L6